MAWQTIKVRSMDVRLMIEGLVARGLVSRFAKYLSKETVDWDAKHAKTARAKLYKERDEQTGEVAFSYEEFCVLYRGVDMLSAMKRMVTYFIGIEDQKLEIELLADRLDRARDELLEFNAKGEYLALYNKLFVRG